MKSLTDGTVRRLVAAEQMVRRPGTSATRGERVVEVYRFIYCAGERVAADTARVESDDEEEQAGVDDSEEEVEDHGTGVVETARRRRRHDGQQWQRAARRTAHVQPRETSLHHRPRHSQTGSSVLLELSSLLQFDTVARRFSFGR